ncbi:MAG: ATP-dependent zinc metalloprotease FtsH [Planctomycetaceae bacterium]
MSQPDTTPPKPADGDPAAPRPKAPLPKKPERTPPNNVFWYLIVFLVVGMVIFSMVNNQNRGTEVKFSEFYAGLQEPRDNPKYTKETVFEVKVAKYEVRFQDQPKSSATATADNATPVRVNHFYVPTMGISDDQQSKLTERMVARGIVFGGEEAPSEWQGVLTLLVIPLIILMFMIFLFRRISGAGTAMSFGRSRGKLFAQEDVGITFDDVAGIDEAVEELREVVEFLRNPGKYQALGGRIPRGVLLVGPPGTGKTLLAKAVAGEAGVPFYSLSGSDFVEMFVGVGAARVRDMFQQAGQRSPAIIFIDELDALGKVRGSGMPGGHDEREQTLNALLVEMDGFGSDQSVIVMGATNRPETLDPALLRPGRFDRHALVDRPDINGRHAILKVHAAKIKMDSNVNLHYIAKLTPGFVGADLANLVNEAALLAARKNKNKVTMKEFEEGIERVVAGLEKQNRIIPEDEKRRVAYHECGHALVATSLPNTDPVHKISIIPRGFGALGYMLQRPEDERQLITQSELESRICVLLGGITAEMQVFNETSTGAQNDLQRATEIARRMVTDFGMSPKLGRVHYSETTRSPFLGTSITTSEQQHSEDTIREIDLEIKRIIDESATTVEEIISSRREILEHMAKRLIETEVMDADQLKEILDQYKTGPQIKPGTFLPPVVADPEADVLLPPSIEEPPREAVEGA